MAQNESLTGKTHLAIALSGHCAVLMRYASVWVLMQLSGLHTVRIRNVVDVFGSQIRAFYNYF